MKDDNCIFCKLANGDIPTNSFFEDEDFKVILDAEPVSTGHALIIPKNHYRNLFDLGDREAARIMPVAKMVATKMRNVLGCDGFNILQNNEEVAGQSVFHYHMHLIPRYKDAPNNDTLLQFSHIETSSEEIKEVNDRLL